MRDLVAVPAIDTHDVIIKQSEFEAIRILLVAL